MSMVAHCRRAARWALLGCLIATAAHARPPFDDPERQQRREEIRHQLLIERDRFRNPGGNRQLSPSESNTGVFGSGVGDSPARFQAINPYSDGQRPERLSAEERRALRQALRDNHRVFGADRCASGESTRGCP